MEFVPLLQEKYLYGHSMINTEKCMAVLKLIDGDQLNLFHQFNRDRETIIDRYKVDLIHALFQL